MSSSNNALYAVPAAWILSILPHFYAITLANKVTTFDNSNPRHAAESLKSKMSKSQFGLFERSEAASQNGFENLGLFAASMAIGCAARLPASTMNAAAGVYLASRVTYNLLYINTEKVSISYLRTVAFLVGVGTCLTVFVKSGNVLNLLL